MSANANFEDYKSLITRINSSLVQLASAKQGGKLRTASAGNTTREFNVEIITDSPVKSGGTIRTTVDKTAGLRDAVYAVGGLFSWATTQRKSVPAYRANVRDNIKDLNKAIHFEVECLIELLESSPNLTDNQKAELNNLIIASKNAIINSRQGLETLLRTYIQDRLNKDLLREDVNREIDSDFIDNIKKKVNRRQIEIDLENKNMYLDADKQLKGDAFKKRVEEEYQREVGKAVQIVQTERFNERLEEMTSAFVHALTHLPNEEYEKFKSSQSGLISWVGGTLESVARGVGYLDSLAGADIDKYYPKDPAAIDDLRSIANIIIMINELGGNEGRNNLFFQAFENLNMAYINAGIQGQQIQNPIHDVNPDILAERLANEINQRQRAGEQVPAAAPSPRPAPLAQPAPAPSPKPAPVAAPAVPAARPAPVQVQAEMSRAPQGYTPINIKGHYISPNQEQYYNANSGHYYIKFANKTGITVTFENPTEFSDKQIALLKRIN